MRVLVIDGDDDVARFIAQGLRQEAYAVDVLRDGAAAGEQARAIDYDVVILDPTLPGHPRFDLLREIRRRKPSLPIVMVSAAASIDERIAGLDAGADDYMVKPVALGELLARLRALLRRGARLDPVLRVADLEIDTVRRTVRRAGVAIDLRPKEYAVLEFLMRNGDRPVPRALIVEHVWDLHFDSISNVVEVQINALRKKLDRGFAVPLIKTVRGVGYMITNVPLPAAPGRLPTVGLLSADCPSSEMERDSPRRTIGCE